MKKITKLSSMLLAAAVSISMLCSAASVSAASPKLNTTKKSIYVGKSFTLKVKNTTKKITWVTSNKKIAKLGSINAKKHSIKIKGLKAGKATITAKIGKTKLKCKVTVKAKPSANGETVEQAKPTIKEYKVLSFYKQTSQAIEESINQYAIDGWVVKGITSYVEFDNRDNVYVVLERDKTT